MGDTTSPSNIKSQWDMIAVKCWRVSPHFFSAQRFGLHREYRDEMNLRSTWSIEAGVGCYGSLAQ